MATVNINNVSQDIGLKSAWAVLGENQALAKASKFYVNINLPSIWLGEPQFPSPTGNSVRSIVTELGFLCESAEISGRMLETLEARYYGPSFKHPYMSTYEDLTLTFLVRDDYLEREFFDTWMEFIQPSTTFDYNYRDSYSTEIQIFQISDVGSERSQAAPGSFRAAQDVGTGLNESTAPFTATYTLIYEKAYPIMVSSEAKSWADDNFSRVAVTFTYLKWRRAEGLQMRKESFHLLGDAYTKGSTGEIYYETATDYQGGI